MRVLVATDQWFPDVRGGVARVAAEVAQGLAARGHDVTVLAPKSRIEPEELHEGSLTLLRRLDRHGLPQTLVDTFETRRLLRDFDAKEFDLVIGHQATTAMGLALGHVDAPLVLVFHASALRESRFLRSRARSPWSRMRLRTLEVPLTFLERTAVRRASRILALSEFSRALLAEDHPAFAHRVSRVSGGVNTSVFSPGDGMLAARDRVGLSHASRVLLTVRRLEPRMGLETLIHAARFLDKDVEIVIAGSGSRREALRSLAASLGLESRVRFAGCVSDEALPDFYRAADLFVLPSAAYEGFGIATVEALACGTPVVGTPVGATPELLGPLEPRLVAAGADASALADTIRAMLASARGSLRARARRYVEETFAWDVVMEGWEEALRRAIGHASFRSG